MQSICLLLVLVSIELTLGQPDIDALLEMKKGFQSGPSGRILDTWNADSLASDGCPKDWFGISCNKGHVTAITLNDLDLVGELNFLPISSLPMLANLSLSNNQLSGTISKDITSIRMLANLDLSRNSFSGSIPLQLLTLRNLVFLNVSCNNLEGQVPPGFDSLKLLKYLDLHCNRFSGNVMSLLSELGAVMHVDLSFNRLSGPLDVGIVNPDFVSSIRYLNISSNDLSGELFPHDGMPFFDSLEVFDASDNHFVGNVPSFSFVVSLRVVKLGGNQLSGSLPQGLLQESSMVLSELDLSRNLLEGPVSSITSINLRRLNLSWNRLSGPLPIRLGHCSVVDLSHNLFSGNLSRAQSWGNYIEVIELSCNGLTGSFPDQTSQFLRLTSLRISNNSIEGILPSVLGTYPELQVIDFSLNKLSGSLVASLFNSTKLTDIDLSMNNFSGTIPADPVAVPPWNYTLLSLNLSHNALTGELPPELARFQSMLRLDLSNNLLEGSIPDGFPGSLTELNLSYNNLSGTVLKSLQRFTPSSFHPGNFLLVLPNEGTPPESGNNLRRGSQMKNATRAALIAGAVCVALAVVVLTFVIYWRVHRDERKATSTETGGKKALSSTGEVSSVARSGKELDHPESTRKGDAELGQQSENPSVLKVCSPDKLAGDLQLFDNSLKFTADELSVAPAEAIGMSCHGTLYKAVLSSGEVLAVKLLKEGIAKGRKEFAREAKKLGNIRHPNLVSIQGFYWGPKEHEKLIISKFIDAPCLALYLHGNDPGTLCPLSLSDRLKIALNVACCLAHMHMQSAIPHGNLKSTNILIEIPNVDVLLTDYSLHRLLTASGTAEQVLNAGALGYLPPEFTSTSKPCPSLKSDVYAFGVILLELLTGRSSADIIPGNPDVVELSEWVSLMAAQNRGAECFDPRLVGTDGPPSGLDGILGVALKCILPAAERPDMKMIFEELSEVVV